MANQEAYAKPSDYTQWKDRRTGADDPLLAIQLAAMSDLLDRRLGEPYGFHVDAATTTFVYGPRDPIMPISSVAGLIVKSAPATQGIVWGDYGALVLDTDFELLPRNALGMRIPRPYTRIELWHMSPASPAYWTHELSRADYRIQITALHGWPGGCPDSIHWACLELVALMRTDSAFSTAAVQEGAETFVDQSHQARALLNSLSLTYGRTAGIGIA